MLSNKLQTLHLEGTKRIKMKNNMFKKFLILSLLLFSNSVLAQADYKTEIAHLIGYVKATQCTYIRNGISHKGAEGASHIKKKYDHHKKDVASAEDFIRLSATKSMITGRKYHIQCTGSPKIESGVWLLQELDRYRKQESK